MKTIIHYSFALSTTFLLLGCKPVAAKACKAAINSNTLTVVVAATPALNDKLTYAFDLAVEGVSNGIDYAVAEYNKTQSNKSAND